MEAVTMYKAEKRPTKATHRDEEGFDTNGDLACKITPLRIRDDIGSRNKENERLWKNGGTKGKKHCDAFPR